MSTAEVYRPTRDTFSGSITDPGYLGDITGVVLGGVSARPLARFPGVQDTTGKAGFPKDAPITVKPGDKVVIAGVAYTVSGPEEWSEPTLWGHDFGLYWLTLESTSN